MLGCTCRKDLMADERNHKIQTEIFIVCTMKCIPTVHILDVFLNFQRLTKWGMFEKTCLKTIIIVSFPLRDASGTQITHLRFKKANLEVSFFLAAASLGSASI